MGLQALNQLPAVWRKVSLVAGQLVTMAHATVLTPLTPITGQVVTVAKHKKHPPAGKKSQLRLNRIWLDQADALEVAEGEEVTLMEWGNAIIRKIHRTGAVVTGIDADLHLAGDFKTTKWKLTWLAQVSDNLTLCASLNFSFWQRQATCWPRRGGPALACLTPASATLPLRWRSWWSCSCPTSTTSSRRRSLRRRMTLMPS